MGNHLVAKLAFFPPDPAKYGKDGLFFRARPESDMLLCEMLCETTGLRRVSVQKYLSLSTIVLDSHYKSGRCAALRRLRCCTRLRNALACALRSDVQQVDGRLCVADVTAFVTTSEVRHISGHLLPRRVASRARLPRS
jgi:hypothetical protein